MEGDKVGCPWHYAEFELATGNHVNAPATCGVKTYPVTVEDGKLMVEV